MGDDKSICRHNVRCVQGFLSQHSCQLDAEKVTSCCTSDMHGHFRSNTGETTAKAGVKAAFWKGKAIKGSVSNIAQVTNMTLLNWSIIILLWLQNSTDESKGISRYTFGPIGFHCYRILLLLEKKFLQSQNWIKSISSQLLCKKVVSIPANVKTQDHQGHKATRSTSTFDLIRAVII